MQILMDLDDLEKLVRDHLHRQGYTVHGISIESLSEDDCGDITATADVSVGEGQICLQIPTDEAKR